MRHIACIEPLGLELVGAAVSDRYDVRLVDMLVRPSDLDRTLNDFTPDIVGVTCEAVREESALNVLRTIRERVPECLTVVGGHQPTMYPGDFDDPAVDLVVLGEGVDAFRAICETRAAGESNFKHIAGLKIRTSDGLVDTEPRPLPTTLDDQPFPDRSLTARYRKHYYFLTEPSAAAVRTAFGCRHSCSFCPGTLYFCRHFVPRDPQLMFEEIRSIKEPFILFSDNGTFHDPDQMWELGKKLVDAGIKKRYYGYTRADVIVRNPELMELWARAGLSILFIGLEAIDDEALERMNKGSDTSYNERALRVLERLGISVTAGLVVDPAADKEYFRRLDRYIKAHPSILHAEFTPLTPFPGTRYHQQQKQNVVSSDWQLYDLQHFVTKTVLPPKELYRLIFHSYRKIVGRVIRKEQLWRPIYGLRPQKIRLLIGMIKNAIALRRAHRHVPWVPMDENGQDPSEPGSSELVEIAAGQDQPSAAATSS
jgi:radical SAM superfamily enzyme YgiQ (UPF0313 family)